MKSFPFSFPICLLLIGVSTAMSADRPNILLAISDDQSWPHTGIYGASELQTPSFDRVAKAGVLFQNAFAASPGCSPSRAALLTGQHTWQIQEAGTHASSFPADLKVYPEVLAENGYHVGYTGKGWGPGNWKITGRKQNPAGPSYSKRKMRSPGGISATDYAANFVDFLDAKEEAEPFCFWFGCHEPHRSYKDGIGKEMGKNPDNVDVPEFLPDAPIVRSDLADYFAEIEWFDQHLGRMLDELEKRGELENTLVIVTADNGMPFPRAKANCYELGIHVPLAISWAAEVPGHRSSEELVGFVDLTATILAAAEFQTQKIDMPLSGRSLLPLLKEESTKEKEERLAVYSARERHSSSRYMNWTYPQRAMRTDQYLLIRNFRPERWPAGAPQKFEKSGELGPMHGGYHDIDACPSLTFLINERDSEKFGHFLDLAVNHRPAVELFDIKQDPACLNNLADNPKHAETRDQLVADFEKYLRDTKDPRIIDGGDVYDDYIRYSPIRSFPKPERE